MMKLQYGLLRLGYFVTGRYCTTIQYTANLAELAYGRLKVIDPLGMGCFVCLEASGVPSLEVWWHHRLRW